MSSDAGVAVIIVGAGQVPEALLAAAEGVLGPLPDVSFRCFEAAMDPAELRAQLQASLDAANQGRGVLFLADLCGSSLVNQCYALARERADVEVLCGANLAMLMKLYSVDRGAVDPTGLARQLADSGRKSIHLASEHLLADGPAMGE